MRRSLLVASLVSVALVASAHAQRSNPVSPELRAAADAVMSYVNGLPSGGTDVVGRSDHYLNAPRAEVQATLARARDEVESATARLAALQPPATTFPGFDLTFALVQLREKSAASIADARSGVEALEKMVAAQDAADCFTYFRQRDVLQDAQAKLRSSWKWYDTQTIQSLLATFAGIDRPPAPAPSPPPGPAQIEADSARRNALLADDLSFHLRCPLPAASLSFALEVTVPASIGRANGGKMPAIKVVSISDESQRGPLEMRLRSFAIREPHRFYAWTLLGKPLKFQWSDQHMVPAA